ncbi:hypothetical protein [Pseudocnuella soli]|uniref:hypothetical protein n=1 Tax=Pseudocnuella soli TaxID=2502779 RepID=UPI00104F3178|nr:hypothetical protein [Pseudocnuella soli]
MKRLIEFETITGKSIIIDGNAIIAVQEESKETTNIYCHGLPMPLTVASSTFNVYVKLTKYGFASLAQPIPAEELPLPASIN